MSSSFSIADEKVMTADDAAAFWLVQRDRGVVLEKDPRFIAWLAASQAHHQAWQRALAIWRQIGVCSDPLLDAMRKEAFSARQSTFTTYWKPIAASLAAAVLIGVTGWYVIGAQTVRDMAAIAPTQLVPTAAEPVFVAGTNGPESFSLPDGSLVTLNRGSELAVAYSGTNRAVRLLKGEAFFAVIHDPGRPFTADAGTYTVHDLGTDFNVRLTEQMLSVLLVTGALSVTTPTDQEPIVLVPGQRLNAASGQPTQVVDADMSQELSWRLMFVEFQNEPLEMAIAEVNRYGGAPARIVDASVRNERVSGRFRTGDPSRFAMALAEVYPLNVMSRADGGVDISRR